MKSHFNKERVKNRKREAAIYAAWYILIWCTIENPEPVSPNIPISLYLSLIKPLQSQDGRCKKCTYFWGHGYLMLCLRSLCTHRQMPEMRWNLMIQLLAFYRSLLNRCHVKHTSILNKHLRRFFWLKMLKRLNLEYVFQSILSHKLAIESKIILLHRIGSFVYLVRTNLCTPRRYNTYYERPRPFYYRI